ncbi:DDE-type integrase/transposase/recombinase, partial [Bacillus cereus]|uniref:DDE-type integrase/transposase/recombinase n=1 Tax=Bacillus cereus TaxID=1396 RepID=UPI0012ADF6D2
EKPTVLTTDKPPTLLCALKKLKHNGFYVHTKHCTVKHFNNLIEQDHRHIKRRFAKSAGFQNLRHASRTLKGIETIHALYKHKRSLQQPNFVFSTYNELQQLFKPA